MLPKIFYTSGRTRLGLCILLGVIAAFGHPPFNFILAPLIAFPLWLMLVFYATDTSWRKFFAMGWAFGLGYFTLGLYWITFSLGVYIDKFWWLIPVSLFGIPAFLGIYTGLMTLVLKWFRTRILAFWFSFATLWAISEFAWSSGPLAFPWNPLGLIWSSFDPIIQSVALFGIDGLSLLSALFVSFPILFFEQKVRLSSKASTAFIIAIFIGLGTYGLLRKDESQLTPSEDLPTLRLVQPNIPQSSKWDQELIRGFFEQLAELSSHGNDQPDLIIWPESALPLFIEETPFARQIIASYLKPGGYFITGTIRRDGLDHLKLWNSLVVINHYGTVVEHYDKHHLVPFGEYLPFRPILPTTMTKITYGAIDYTPGDGVETLDISPYPSFSPLICFEGIFSGEVVAQGSERPQWLLNITNDAWFGDSSGPYQHLQMVRLRAIEEGLPLVRVANTGISAVFDAYGHEVARIPFDTAGALDIQLPPALITPPPFTRMGTVLYILMLFSVFGLSLLTRDPLGRKIYVFISKTLWSPTRA